MSAASSRTGVAVMASFSDFGLAPKDARGVIAEATVLPRPLLAAQGVLARFGQQLGVRLDGAPRDVAQAVLAACSAAQPAVEKTGVTNDQRLEP